MVSTGSTEGGPESTGGARWPQAAANPGLQSGGQLASTSALTHGFYWLQLRVLSTVALLQLRVLRLQGLL